MVEHIVVINPNSTEAVTAAMDEGLAPLRIAGRRSSA
jgi:Asp/Glu/hydantoin racemase